METVIENAVKEIATVVKESQRETEAAAAMPVSQVDESERAVSVGVSDLRSDIAELEPTVQPFRSELQQLGIVLGQLSDQPLLSDWAKELLELQGTLERLENVDPTSELSQTLLRLREIFQEIEPIGEVEAEALGGTVTQRGVTRRLPDKARQEVGRDILSGVNRGDLFIERAATDIEKIFTDLEKEIEKETERREKIDRESRVELEKLILTERAESFIQESEQRYTEGQGQLIRALDEFRNIFDVSGIVSPVVDFQRDFRSDFREVVSEVAEYQRILTDVQERAREQVELERQIGPAAGEEPLRLEQLQEQFDLPEEFQQRLYTTYLDAYKEASEATFGDISTLEDRIESGVRDVAESSAKDFVDAWEDARDRDEKDAEDWLKFQRQVQRDAARAEKQREREMAKEVRDAFNQQRAYVADFVTLVDDALISRDETLQVALQTFLEVSARRILQDFLETQLLIYNQRRLQKEYAKTAAIQTSLTQTTAVTNALSTATAGVGAAGLAAGPLGFVPLALSVLLQLGEGQVREISNIQEKLQLQRR